MPVTPGKLIRKTRIQLQASPKQAMILGVLAVVFLVVLVRMIFVLGPASADAMPLPPELAPTLTKMAGLAAPASRVSSTAPTMVRPPLPEFREQVERDIFATTWVSEASRSKPKSIMAYPISMPSAERPIPALVLDLTLTGAIDTAKHYAVINGKKICVGESTNGFVVETINPGFVVLLDSQNERVVIRMK